jgi:hypothetical protein
MLENIRGRVFALVARELGVCAEKLHEGLHVTPEGWFQIALVCDAHLVPVGIIYWSRPERSRSLGDIITAIFHHNSAAKAAA